MSTNASITLRDSNAVFHQIYCHYDGYIEGGVGETLFNHYTDANKVKKLISLGDLSTLGEVPESIPDYWKKSFEDLMTDNRCGTYASRGENLPAETYNGLDEFIENCDVQEYNYLFDEDFNEWYTWTDPEELREMLVPETFDDLT